MNPLFDTSTIWAAEDRHLRGMLDTARRMAARPSTSKTTSTPPPEILSIDGGIATLRIDGLLLRQHDADLEAAGVANTGYGEIGAALDALDGATGLVLAVNSPGGSAQGCGACADLIRDTAAKIPVVAHISVIGASGAYWLASQANRIIAERDAIVGSVGCFSVMRDYSEMLEGAGIKTHVLRYGERKGAHIVGARLTEGQLATEQGIVDALGTAFLEAVTRGRGRRLGRHLGEVQKGGYWSGLDAERRGLVDGTGHLDTARAALKTASTAPAAHDAARLAYMRELDKARATGLTYVEAMRSVATAQPNLYRAYAGRE